MATIRLGGGEMRSTSSLRYRPVRLRLVAALLPVMVGGLGAAAPSSSAAPKLGPAFGSISPGVLNVLAVHRGAVSGRAGVGGRSGAQPLILPNVRASNIGPGPVNENPITADPANPMILLSAGNDYNCATIQGFYASFAAGATWPVQHCMDALPGKVGFGDPGVAVGIDGALYAFGVQATSTLTDGVVAFQKYVAGVWTPVAAGPTAFYAGGFTDKEWTEIDHSPTSPFYGCIYTSVTQYNPAFTRETITVDHSCDGGTTWSGPKAVSAAAVYPTVRQFSDLAVGNDGTVYATWIRCDAAAGECASAPALAHIEFSKSTNGGNTWSAPIVVAVPVLAPDACGCAFYGNVPTTNERTSEIPVIDVNATNHLYILVYNYAAGPGQMRLFSITSMNGGATWGAPVRVFPGTSHDQFLPWLSVNDANGWIWVTYLLRSGGNYQPYVARSINDGAGWQGNLPLTGVLSQFALDGFGGNFMGDYTGNIWAGSSLHAAWVDTRTGTAADWTGGV